MLHTEMIIVYFFNNNITPINTISSFMMHKIVGLHLGSKTNYYDSFTYRDHQSHKL